MASAFDNLAPRVIGDLIRDLRITPEQAAGIVGNLGAESGLLAIQEHRPLAGRGGFGWAQWTGPRRVAFERWCQANGLNIESYEANYGFLVHELRTSHASSLAKVRLTSTAKAAAETFGYWFERFAGFENLNSANYRHRIKLAERALALYKARTPTPAEASLMTTPAPNPPLPPKPQSSSRIMWVQLLGFLAATPLGAKYLAGVDVSTAIETLSAVAVLATPVITAVLRRFTSRPIEGTAAAENVRREIAEIRAEVPPGYVLESARPVHEAWDTTPPSSLGPISLDSLDDIVTGAEKVVGTVRAMAPIVMPVLSALVAASQALEKHEPPKQG